MALTEDDLTRVRNEVDARVSAISVDVMGALSALSDHADRFNRIDRRLDSIDGRLESIDRKVDEGLARVDARIDSLGETLSGRIDGLGGRLDHVEQTLGGRLDRLDQKLDTRFGWQTVTIAAATAIMLFAEPIRAAIGV